MKFFQAFFAFAILSVIAGATPLTDPAAESHLVARDSSELEALVYTFTRQLLRFNYDRTEWVRQLANLLHQVDNYKWNYVIVNTAVIKRTTHDGSFTPWQARTGFNNPNGIRYYIYQFQGPAQWDATYPPPVRKHADDTANFYSVIANQVTYSPGFTTFTFDS